MNDRFGYQPTTNTQGTPPKAPKIPRPNDTSLGKRKDDIFKAILASRVYGDARTHERGMERVFEMFNKYFEEN